MAKTLWRRVGLIAVLLPISFFFPLGLVVVVFTAWTIYKDLTSQPDPPPPTTWRTAKPDDDEWLELFLQRCESPAEERFLQVMVKEFNLQPDGGVLKSPQLTLAMQVEVQNYRYDFLANGRQVIEVDGAEYHSSTEQVERDRIRDEYSIQNGYKVLRIPALVVFRKPDETIRRVKAALAETPVFTKPQKIILEPHIPRPNVNKKTVLQYIDAFFDGVDKINRHVEGEGHFRKATEGFQSAIDREQLLLDAVVILAENDQRKGEKSADRLPVIYDFKINLPDPVADNQIQQRIEAAFQLAIGAREGRLSELRGRCEDDPVFTRCLSQRLMEVRFPAEEAVKIVPVMSLMGAVYGPGGTISSRTIAQGHDEEQSEYDERSE